MNEQLQNTINTILQNAIEAASAGTEFLKGEIPEVVQQLLLWKLAESSVLGIVGILGLAGIAWATPRFWRYLKKETYIEPAIMFMAIPVLASLGMCSNLMTALKIWLAPKVWLLEYAASIVKGN